MQPKMGKINIDYQILHDAFFKFQTKPKLTQHGDMCVPPRHQPGACASAAMGAAALLTRALVVLLA